MNRFESAQRQRQREIHTQPLWDKQPYFAPGEVRHEFLPRDSERFLYLTREEDLLLWRYDAPWEAKL